MITRRGLVWNAWVRPRVKLVCPVYLRQSSLYVDSISGTFLPVSLKAYHRGQFSFCKASGNPRVKWKKQKGSQEYNCWECKQQSQSGQVKDQSRSQSRSWSGGNRSAARRREELEAVPRRLTNGNIWRLNYPLKGKKERERTLGLSLLSVLVKFKGPQVGIPQRLWWEDGFPRGSAVKNLPAMQEPQKTGVQCMVGEICWRRAWQPTLVFLPGESHGQRSLAGYSPWDHKESDRTEATQRACTKMRRDRTLALLGCIPSYTAHPSWWWHPYGQWLLSLGP